MKLVVNRDDVEVDDRHAETPLLWVLRDVIGMHGTTFRSGARFGAYASMRHLREPSAQPRPYKGDRR
jgi:hypothetical protein